LDRCVVHLAIFGMRGGEGNVERLRAQLEALDYLLVLLISSRLELARRIIEERQRKGESLSCPPQESRVLRRARRWARECRVSEILIGDFWEALITEGKREARTLSEKAPIPRDPFATGFAQGERPVLSEEGTFRSPDRSRKMVAPSGSETPRPPPSLSRSPPMT
jgi:chorismate mutase